MTRMGQMVVGSGGESEVVRSGERAIKLGCQAWRELRGYQAAGAAAIMAVRVIDPATLEMALGSSDLSRAALSERDTMAVARAIAGQLVSAHAEGVIHRDIKPANILMVEGRAVLIDWGMARVPGMSEMPDGIRFGTPRYMAPEQASARRSHEGPWTDAYQLGRTLSDLCVQTLREGRSELLRIIDGLTSDDIGQRVETLTSLAG